MNFKPTHIVKKTGEKVRVLKIFEDGDAMCHHRLILAEPYYYPIDALKEIKKC